MDNCIHSELSGISLHVRCNQGLFNGLPTFDQCQHCLQRFERPSNGSGTLTLSPTSATEHTIASQMHWPAQKRARESAPISDLADQSDDQQARWGRERHEGFKIGRYLQPPPLLFTADHHPIWLGDIYRGRSAFLICGGPSFGHLNFSKLAKPGILTMGLNNSPKTFRPNLWVSIDNPDHFLRSIWLDPTILKFTPICHAHKRIFNSDCWTWMDYRVRDCPNVIYYKRNEHFQPRQFLWEDTLNWGNHKSHGGGRSVMLPAIRMLFILGVRRVFLLGADFKMSQESKYHFSQARTRSSINGNNSTYAKLNQWFARLRPLFEAEGFYVFNCNPDSGLGAFDFVSFDSAIAAAANEWGSIDLEKERTEGLYDQRKI